MARQYYQEMDVGPDLGNQTKAPIGPKEYIVESLIRSLGIDEPMRKVLDNKPVDEQLQILGMLNKAMQQSGIAEGGLGMLSDVMKGTDNMLNIIEEFRPPSF
jgi:hypothetical protein